MSTAKNTTQLLSTLRQCMCSLAYASKPLDAYIIPSGDAHQSEITADCDQRRAFISGFTGSMGTAIVTNNKAALWTDGRYYLQAGQEMDDNWTLMKQGQPDTPKEANWLVSEFKNMKDKRTCTVGVDSLLFTCTEWEALFKELSEAGHELLAVEQNLVDIVWGNERPPRPSKPITILEERWTGKSHAVKLQELRDKLKASDCSAIVLTALDDVAYLLNLRGSDISFNPVFFCYAIVQMDAAVLFIDCTKVSDEVKQHLMSANVSLAPYENILPYLHQLCKTVTDGKKVWIPNRCSYAVSTAVPKSKKHSECTPVTVTKAIKNDTEISGMEACHVRDGAAVCSFLTWLQVQAPLATQTEISAADYLESCRAKQEHFRGLSFETISSVGSNAAIVHYRPHPSTNKVITDKEIYLVDSGGHYNDGTTDVTRTVHFGQPSAEEMEAFTRVLKGHIALATAVFPEKIKGNCLDSLARLPLWSVGLDYGHGTGHGVGMFLNVHEGPMGISWRPQPDDPGLQAGMFLSNEPGYYAAGSYGIRIENINRIVKAETRSANFLTFAHTTLVPIQTTLIDTSLMTDQEINWLNSYHDIVREKVGGLLKSQGDLAAYNWVVKETEPLKRASAN